jgi:hypothetical protein
VLICVIVSASPKVPGLRQADVFFHGSYAGFNATITAVCDGKRPHVDYECPKV